MSIDTTASLGDLVTQDPRRSRVFEELGLDFCCHGQRSLVDACSEAGLDVADIAARLELDGTAPATEWRSYGVAQLARHILDVHHSYLWDEMPRLGDLVEKVVTVHGPNHPELKQVGDDYFTLVADLSSHLTKEEQILFPAIIALGQGGEPTFLGSVRAPILQMLAEHDIAGELLARIRATTQGYAVPDDACGSYTAMLNRLEFFETDLHEHIHKENNVLFPAVLELESQSGSATRV